MTVLSVLDRERSREPHNQGFDDFSVYKLPMPNEILLSTFLILSVWKHSPLLASHILTVPSSNADASRVESWEKATDLTSPLRPSAKCLKVILCLTASVVQ
jgi:hypothetical protein